MGCLLSAFDISIAGFRVMGLNAKSNYIPIVGQRNGRFEPFLKFILIFDDMIGRENT